MSVKTNEKTSADKNNDAKEVVVKDESKDTSGTDSAKQNSSDKVEPKEIQGADVLNPDEILTSTMTGQVVAKKSDENSEAVAEDKTAPGYDDFLNKRNEEREIVGGEQRIASGVDKGRPIGGDGLVDTSVPSAQEARFIESDESSDSKK